MDDIYAKRSGDAPLPHLVGASEDQIRKEERAQKLGKFAFRLAVVLLASQATLCFAGLTLFNMYSFRQIPQADHWLNMVRFCIFVACWMVFFIGFLSRKTKPGRRAMLAPLFCFLGEWVFWYGPVLLLHMVGIYPRY